MKYEMLRVYARMVIYCLNWLDSHALLAQPSNDPAPHLLLSLWNRMFSQGLFQSKTDLAECEEAVNDVEENNKASNG